MGHVCLLGLFSFHQIRSLQMRFANDSQSEPNIFSYFARLSNDCQGIFLLKGRWSANLPIHRNCTITPFKVELAYSVRFRESFGKGGMLLGHQTAKDGLNNLSPISVARQYFSNSEITSAGSRNYCIFNADCSSFITFEGIVLFAGALMLLLPSICCAPSTVWIAQTTQTA